MAKFKKILPVILVLSIAGSIYYSYIISPYSYTVKQYTIEDTNIPEEFKDFKIGFISDFNLNENNTVANLNNIVTTINNQSYDMILFGGDLYESKVFNDDKVIEALKSIVVPYGKFAVLGEKDIINESEYVLLESGFEVLHNNQRTIYYNDASINLYGLEANDNLTGIEVDSHYSIALIHQPDYFDGLSNQNIDLQLSGHSNGGYINIPFIGGLFKKEGATNFINGKTVLDNKTLLISNGLGNELDYPIRFNNPCQIITIEFN